MKAKKKPLDVKKPADLGVDISPRVVTLKVSEPAGRKGGIKGGEDGTSGPWGSVNGIEAGWARIDHGGGPYAALHDRRTVPTLL